MSFSQTFRYMALAPELVPTLFPALESEYAALLPDGSREIATLGGHRAQDSEPLVLRAASLFDGTIRPDPLTDGRVCYGAFWESRLEAEFLAHGLLGVEELTFAEFQSLRVPPTPIAS